MATRLAWIACLLALLFSGPEALAEPSSCLQCHAPHYAPRSCTDCHQGNPRTTRENIAHQRIIPGEYAFFRWPQSSRVREGKRLIRQLACRRCHLIADQGNPLAAALSYSPGKAKVTELASSIRAPAAAMPDFKLAESDIAALVNALLALSLERKAPSREDRRVVHFTKPSPGQKPFEKHCGGCHSMLTQKRGSLGSGDVGPNLSGLMTEFYPSSSDRPPEWTPEKLRQ